MIGADVLEAAEKAGLDDSDRSLLQVLAELAGLVNCVMMTERELAAVTGISRSAVWRRMHRLEDAGWLEAERFQGRPTFWTLLIPDGARA